MVREAVNRFYEVSLGEVVRFERRPFKAMPQKRDRAAAPVGGP